MNAIRSLRAVGALGISAVFASSVSLGGAAASAQTPQRTNPTNPANVELSVTISPPRLTVGDRAFVIFDLKPNGPLTSEPRFPDWRESWGEAEVLAVGAVERTEDGGAPRFRQTVEIAAYHTGRVALPPVEIAVPLRGGTVQVSSPKGLALDIGSVLPSDPNDPARVPKPPQAALPLPWGERFWWTAGTMAAAVLLLGFLLIRRERNAAAPTIETAPPLGRFEELERAIAATVADLSPEQAHVGLSTALRRYLGRALEFPALEETTSEIHRQLVSRRTPTPATRGAIDALRACDGVKFARRPATRERVEQLAAAALAVATSIERQLDGTATVPTLALPTSPNGPNTPAAPNAPSSRSPSAPGRAA